MLQAATATQPLYAAYTLPTVQMLSIIGVLGESDEIWFASVCKPPAEQHRFAKLKVSWLSVCDTTSVGAMLLQPSREKDCSIDLGTVLDNVRHTPHAGSKITVDKQEQERIQEIGKYNCLFLAKIIYCL